MRYRDQFRLCPEQCPGAVRGSATHRVGNCLRRLFAITPVDLAIPKVTLIPSNA